MGPWLDVALADLEWDDAYLLDRVAAAYPPQRVTWSGNTERPVVTIVRTGFGTPISPGPDLAGAGLVGVDGRHEPHSGGLISFSIDIAHIDFGPDPDARSAREERRQMARYRGASIKLADRVRPTLLVRGGQRRLAWSRRPPPRPTRRHG